MGRRAVALIRRAGLNAERGPWAANAGTIEHKSAWLSETAVFEAMAVSENTPAGFPASQLPASSRTARFVTSPPRLRARWQARWQEDGLNATPESDRRSGGRHLLRCRCSPIPRGTCHMGHVPTM